MKGKYVMFDSGTGGQVQPTAGLLAAKNMKAAGIDPAKIETIIVTHFHPDHIFGLMAKDTNAQTYPNATIYLPKPELAWWTGSTVPQPAQGISNRVKATFPGWKNVQQIDGDKEVVGGVRSIATPGHTPGHTSYLVGSGKQQLLVLGDVTNIPLLFVKNPGWQAVFDADACAGGDQSAQDHGSRHCRQADRGRLSLQHARRRHLQARRKRLRFRSGKSLIFTTLIGGCRQKSAPSSFGS